MQLLYTTSDSWWSSSCYKIKWLSLIDHSQRIILLTLYLLTWRIWWALNNASIGQMGFSSKFEVLIFVTDKWLSAMHVMPLLFVCYKQQSCVMCVMSLLIDCYRQWHSAGHVIPILIVCYRQWYSAGHVIPILIVCYRRWPTPMYFMPTSLNAGWWSVCGVFRVTVLWPPNATLQVVSFQLSFMQRTWPIQLPDVRVAPALRPS